MRITLTNGAAPPTDAQWLAAKWQGPSLKNGTRGPRAKTACALAPHAQRPSRPHYRSIPSIRRARTHTPQCGPMYVSCRNGKLGNSAPLGRTGRTLWGQPSGRARVRRFLGGHAFAPPGNPTDEPLSTAAEPCLGANGSRRPPTSPHGWGELKSGTLFGRKWLSPEGRGVKSAPEQGLKFLFAEHRDAQLPGLFELAARFVASDHEVGLTRHARSSAAPVPLDQFVDLVA